MEVHGNEMYPKCDVPVLGRYEQKCISWQYNQNVSIFNDQGWQTHFQGNGYRIIRDI